MSMTRKHYEMIASVISLNKGRDAIIAGLISKFVNDNPLFDEAKFRKACKPERWEYRTKAQEEAWAEGGHFLNDPPKKQD
jgi:hypothetical protein